MNKYEVKLKVLDGRFTYPFVKQITAPTEEKAGFIAQTMIYVKLFPHLKITDVLVTETNKLSHFNY